MSYDYHLQDSTFDQGIPFTSDIPRRRAPIRGRKRVAFGIMVLLTGLASSLSSSGSGPSRYNPRLEAFGDVVRRPIEIVAEIPKRVVRGGLGQTARLGRVVGQVREATLPKKTFRDRSRQVRSVDHLNRLLNLLPLNKLSVKGAGDTNANLRSHPVAKIMRKRLEKGYRPGQLKDGNKIALAIEGGGMRGAVSAGMAHALAVLGLNDAVDCGGRREYPLERTSCWLRVCDKGSWEVSSERISCPDNVGPQ
eukprot:1339394-Amorphochlora_amoeboformis.AAC.1